MHFVPYKKYVKNLPYDNITLSQSVSHSGLFLYNNLTETSKQVKKIGFNPFHVYSAGWKGGVG